MSEVTFTFTIPAAADSPFLFRRAFFEAIRAAVSQAQIDGSIDAPTAIECFKALSPTQPDSAGAVIAQRLGEATGEA